MVCQLDTLRTCLKRTALLKALNQLPKTLDETYDRILLRIPEDYHHDAQIVLTLLAFSHRPITLAEVAEAVAIDLEQKSFDIRNRLPDPCSVLKICSSLVTLSPFEPKAISWETAKFAMNDESKELRFAHYSVKEYLLSRRVSSLTFQIRSDTAHGMIAQLCLIYLLSFHGVIQEHEPVKLQPFLQYSARYWHVHAKATQLANDITTFDLMSLLFYETNENILHNSLKVWNPDNSIGIVFPQLKFATRLYYASIFGLFELCRLLLDRGAEVNAQSGVYCNALQAAASRGHEAIVRLLLERGAEVNAQGGGHRNGLQAAAFRGHEVIVTLLLERGAEVNAQGGGHGNALQAAAFGGHEAIVRLLLERGADVNAQGVHYGNALLAAAFGGHEAIVRLLLERGAEVKDQGGYYRYALHYGGHEAILRLLNDSIAIE